MPVASRRAAALAVDTLCSVVGRRHTVRVARFALNQARLDLPNSPEHNGEYALQRWMLSTASHAEPFTVLDVGANIGDWSVALLRQANERGLRDQVRLHAFEPTSYTYGILRQRLPVTAQANRLALSDTAGQRQMFVVAPGAGRNSLHQGAEADEADASTEMVTAETVDGYLEAYGLTRVDLLKIDTEGHDFAVLLGGQASLAEQRISVIQFEYNHRWVYARRFLKDVFDLAGRYGYRVGKLTPRGVETYPGWDPDLETFVEGNYLLGTDNGLRRLPQVAWWKAAGSSRTPLPRSWWGQRIR
ncbi:FkbM family methyltransferase [Micromonospora sp. NPDC050686]|uniref:FkbM family methyltransferase n=1 Tax=Micromonospora sp. NPDC050686 TaxID=3154631 RepID=UPI0033EAC7E0